MHRKSVESVQAALSLSALLVSRLVRHRWKLFPSTPNALAPMLLCARPSFPRKPRPRFSFGKSWKCPAKFLLTEDPLDQSVMLLHSLHNTLHLTVKLHAIRMCLSNCMPFACVVVRCNMARLVLYCKDFASVLARVSQFGPLA